jgi:signal transduction histidine kinase
MPLHLRPAGLRARLPRRSVRLRLTALYGVLFLLSAAGLLAITNTLVSAWNPSGDFHASGRSAPGAGACATRACHPPPPARHTAPPPGLSQAAEMHLLLAGSVTALAIMAAASVVLGWLVAGRILRPLRAMTTAARQISEDDLSRRLAMTGPGDELKDLADTIDGLLARLEAAFDAQRQFVANASHELRTPLTLTRTLLQMALTDPRPTLASFKATCEDVLAAGDHQEQIIEALLTLARSQRGLDRRALVDLGAVTRDVLRACEPDAASRGLSVTARIAAAPVLGDARLLERLVANLADNAVRHNISRGWLDIRVAADGGRASLAITNTGPVIPADQVGRLLQPFQRLSARRPADDAAGLGLGLSIAAAIARAHQATLAVAPFPHGGLAVDVSFPAAVRGGSAPERALAPA